MMPTAQIYIKRECEAIWEDYKKICKANRWTYSEKIMEHVSNIVATHSGGGSQTHINNIGLPRTLPRYKTCVHSKHKRLYQKEFLCIGEFHGWKIPMACDQCRSYQEDQG